MKSNKLALAVAAAYLPRQWEYVRVVFQDGSLDHEFIRSPNPTPRLLLVPAGTGTTDLLR